MSDRAPKPPRGRGATPSPDSPLRDLLALKERTHRLLEAFLRRGETAPPGWSPSIDLVEERGAFVLSVEVPGVRREDLGVRVEGALVIVEGRRAADREARNALRIERPHGSFMRVVHLPAAVDGAEVRARLDLGVLEVVLPKSTGAASRAIRVQVQS